VIERTVHLGDCPLIGVALPSDCVQCAESMESRRGARIHLETAALCFAANCGNLDAVERAELHALRRLRDGVKALRAELTEHGDVEHAWVAETIDAFFALSMPKVDQ
jgi:hypothetical protein